MTASIIILHHFWCNVNTLNEVYHKIYISIYIYLFGGTLMKNYTERIRDLREDNDKTQQEIAEYLGTTQQVYSRYEKGINEIPIRHIIALCKYYHVSADYILGLKDETN